MAGCGSGGSVPVNTTSLSITSVPPTLTYTGTPLTLTASSNSSGAITFSVVSGPATITGTTLTITGTGTVVIQAAQAASGNYTATTVQYTFTVTAATPTLTFATIANKVVGNAPFTVSASSASPGTVSYAVVSGPATVNGSTVTLTGTVGTVVLSAAQAATANYTTATAQTSFLVLASAANCPTTGTLFCGLVYADGYPVIGAQVQIFAAGNTGAGSAGTALTTALTTNASGLFAVPSTMTCPTAGRAVYVLSKGGLVQVPNATNSALWLMSALPACGSLSSSTSVMVNELSTMGAAVALAQFYANSGSVGASATNAAGLANAMTMEQELVSLQTGSSPGAAPANVTVNAAKLNTLADALSACAAQSSACTPLFTAATVNGTAPTNTLDAAFNIARHPGANVAAVYALTSGNQYSPVLTAQPPDWMLFNTIGGGGLLVGGPTAMGVDAGGNMWTINYSTTAGVLSEFAPTGAAVFANGISNAGLHESYGMTVDASNNIWVENDEPAGNHLGSIMVFNNAGTALTTAPGYTANINYPTGISVDPNTNVWISNFGNSTYALYTAAGTSITTNCNASGCGYGQLVFPVAAQADANHNGWFANQSSNTVTFVSQSGASVQQITCCNGSSGLALDQSGNIWSANYFGDSVSELSPTGTVLLNGVTGGGQVHHPQGIAVDGSGNIWVLNYRGNSLTVLGGATSGATGTALSPASGYGTDAGLLEPFANAIDASGNVWITNYAQGNVVEFLGVATPVKVPVIGLPQMP